MKWNTPGTLLLALLIMIGISSCQKVISVDLNQSSPQLVIEGLVNDRGTIDSVNINMTGNYFTPSLKFPPVTGALVTISDDLGDMDTLSETSPGNYYSPGPKGVPGRTYSLRVIENGKEFDALSTMPQEVTIDSFYYEVTPQIFGQTGYSFYLTFRDPPQPGNYYRIIPHISSIPQDSIGGGRGGFQILDDKLTNGNEITYRFSVRSEIGNELQSGDTVSVDLECIDKSTYDYYSTLRDIIAADQSPTSLSPANPNTNLTNQALGYFSAYTIDTRSLILK